MLKKPKVQLLILFPITNFKKTFELGNCYIFIINNTKQKKDKVALIENAFCTHSDIGGMPL